MPSYCTNYSINSSSKNFNKVKLQESPIHGYGLFAVVDFKAGDVVLNWDNTRQISQEEFDKLSYKEKHFVNFHEGMIFLVGEPERFVNHSCQSNTIPGYKCDIASKLIKAGDEITTDYSNSYIPSGQFKCLCRSSSCRRTISGKNQSE